MLIMTTINNDNNHSKFNYIDGMTVSGCNQQFLILRFSESSSQNVYVCCTLEHNVQFAMCSRFFKDRSQIVVLL